MNVKLVRIAVFDVMPDDCTHTAGAIKSCFDRMGISARIVEYTSDMSFIMGFDEGRKVGSPYDMAFIGIDTVKGAETARNIRRQDEHLPLFIVSEMGEYGVEGFRLGALDYLIKPVSPECVQGAVERIGMRYYGSCK